MTPRTSLLDTSDRTAAGGAVEAAHAAAQVAAARAGVQVAMPHELADLVAATEIWRRIWSPSGEPLVSSEMLRALTHAGNYLSVARAGDEVVGALMAFFGGNGRVDLLHSHILGVEPSAHGHGVGHALKLHQRAWALERGIARMSWTYDPLVRRNGHFNLAKLGARGVEYLVDFYGAMPDAINAGGETDRVLVEWDLAATATGHHNAAPSEDVDAWRARGAEVALDVDATGGPLPQAPRAADLVLCATPPDVIALRRDDPACAGAWRTCVRDVLVEAMQRGLVLSAMARGGWYVLSR